MSEPDAGQLLKEIDDIVAKGGVAVAIVSCRSGWAVDVKKDRFEYERVAYSRDCGGLEGALREALSKIRTSNRGGG